MRFLQSVALATLLVASSLAWAWKVDRSVDRMTGSVTVASTLRSVNSLKLAFPYHGKNHGYITIGGTDGAQSVVIVGIDKGQMLCFQDCSIQANFDDSEIVTFYARSPSDHSSDYVILERPEYFLDWINGAKKIMIRIDVYQGGAPVLEFRQTKALKKP